MGNTVRIRNGMSNATEGDILGSASDIIKDLGVVDLAGGHLLVTQNSPLGMSVQVAGGVVYVPNSNYSILDSDTPKFYPVVCSNEVLAVDNNVSGSTRYDIVCVKIDKVIVPDPDASNVATKVVIKGTPGAGVPSTPANHYKLAEIVIANGETEITNTEITDTREQIIFDERYIKLTPATTTNLTGYLYGDGSKVGTKGIEDGWIPAGETWTYASATTFTISGDKTGKYQKGDKIKLTQTDVKYFYIIGVSYSSPNTTITVTGGSNYSLTSATITSPYFSKIENPQGFPAWFSWSPSYSASASMTYTSVSTDFAKFKLTNDCIQWRLQCSGITGGIASTFLEATPPLVGSDGFNQGFGYSGTTVVRAYYSTNTDKLTFGKYDNSNYELGTTALRVAGFYPYTV